jgi:hypothetical protein
MTRMREKRYLPKPSRKAHVTSWVWGSEGVGDEVKVTIRVPDSYRERFMDRLHQWLDRTFIEVDAE